MLKWTTELNRYLLSLLVVLPLTMIAAREQLDITYAQEHTTIRGKVTNGTAYGKIPAGLPITLTIQGLPNDIIENTSIDSKGEFAFENISTGGTQYSLSVDYAGVSYRKAVGFPVTPDPVIVTIYESTTSMPGIVLTDTIMVINQHQSRDSVLNIEELIQLNNPTEQTFLPSFKDTEDMTFLRFSLPPGFQDVHLLSDLPQGHLLEVDLGIATTNPVPPGNHELILRYAIPYQGNDVDLSRSFPLATQTLWVLLPQELGTFHADAPMDFTTTSMGTTTYKLYKITDLSPGDRIAMNLTDVTGFTLWYKSLKVLRAMLAPSVSIPMSLGILLVIVLLIGYFRGRRAPIKEFALPDIDTHNYETPLKNKVIPDKKSKPSKIDCHRLHLYTANLKNRFLKLIFRSAKHQVESDQHV